MDRQALRLQRANARRLRATIQRVEQQPYGLPAANRAPRALPSTMAIARITVAFTARSGTTLGTGTVAIQQISGSTMSDGATQSVLNFAASTFAVGKYCAVAPFAGGWVLVSVEC